MDYYRKYLKYKEKYLRLKAELEGGLITRDLINPEKLGDLKEYLDKPEFFIAYKEDNLENIEKYNSLKKVSDEKNKILPLTDLNHRDHIYRELGVLSTQMLSIKWNVISDTKDKTVKGRVERNVDSEDFLIIKEIKLELIKKQPATHPDL